MLIIADKIRKSLNSKIYLSPRVLGEGMWACSVLRALPHAEKMRIGGYDDWARGDSMILICK